MRLATLVLAPSLLVVGACSSKTEAGPTKGSETKALVVGSDLTYPPYASLEGNKPVGFDPEMATALAERMKTTAQIKDTRFEQLIPSLASGRIDVIASALYITKERSAAVDYVPYFSTGNSIVVGTGKQPIADATGLCGLRVAVIKGGDIVQRLRKDASADCTAGGKKAVDVREFATDPEATQAVTSGQVDAQVTDAAVASTLKKNTNGKVQVSSDELLYPIPVGLAVKKGNTELRDRVEAALNDLKKDGTYDRFLKKYNLAPVDDAQVESILGSG